MDWRPMSNREERDPQLTLHILEGNFDGLCVGRVMSEEMAVEMDEGLWSQLTVDLLRKVLLRLPYVSQFRFRAVCKIWLDMLSSSTFLRESAAIRSSIPDTPPICAYEYECPNLLESSVLLPTEGFEEVRTPSQTPQQGGEELVQRLRDALHRSAGRRKMQRMDLSFAPSWIMANKITASRDGLICATPCKTSRLKGPKSAHGGLCVLNPFTRTWRELPPVPDLVDGKTWPWAHELMVDRASPSHFLVYVILGTMHGEWFICRYSSKNSDWAIISGDTKSAPIDCRDHFFAGGFLYSWKVDGSLLVYSSEDGHLLTSSRPGYPDLPFRGTDFTTISVEVLEHEGRIVVGWSLTLKKPAMPILGFSMLSTAMKWEQLVILPEAMMHNRISELALEEADPDVPPLSWELEDYKVLSLGHFICFKLTHRETSHDFVSHNLVGFHTPSQTWKSFDSSFPHVLESTDIEFFVPTCLQVRL